MRGRGLGHIATAGGDDGQSSRHGLKDGECHALGFGSVDEDIRRRISRGLGGLVEEAEPVDAGGASTFAHNAEKCLTIVRLGCGRTGDEEMRRRSAEQAERLDDVLEALLGRDTADEEHYPICRL